MTRRALVPWADAKAAYIYGEDRDGRSHYPTLVDLAARYGVATRTIAERSGAEQWEAARRAAQEDQSRRMGEARANALAKRAADLDDRAAKVFEATLSIIGKRIADAHNAKREIPPKELNELVRAAEIAHRGARLALGESTERVDLPKGMFVVTGGGRTINGEAEEVDDDAA